MLGYQGYPLSKLGDLPSYDIDLLWQPYELWRFGRGIKCNSF
jgi:hypothetical protein